MAQLKGFVTHIIYRNNGNGYTVFELNTGDEITCVGTFQSLEEGEILELEGDFTEHAVYGSQFKVRKPAFFRTGLKSASASSSALAIP